MTNFVCAPCGANAIAIVGDPGKDAHVLCVSCGATLGAWSSFRHFVRDRLDDEASRHPGTRRLSADPLPREETSAR